MTKNYLEFQYVIGRGGFGKVWQVLMKKNNKKYALKEMSKVKIIDRHSEKSIKDERYFLSKLHHPFIVNMICSFQDYENLYLVMDLLTGGDLRYHLCRIRKFSEEETKFFISCVLLGLEYIHNNKIIHRDIKPENLCSDENGYIRITDFGVAKIHKKNNSSETSGTPGYMAPEVLMAKNHSYTVDFFAIGIIGYEFMFGQRPYLGKNRKEIKHLVLKKQAKINEDEKPDDWSYESVDFINKCLKRKVEKRLGYLKGVEELKSHEWFNGFDWNGLYRKTLNAPFVPKKEGNYDKKYCQENEKNMETTLERYRSILNDNDFDKIFEGYTFINYELINNSFGETVTRTTTNSKSNRLVNSNTTNSNNDKKNYGGNSSSKNINRNIENGNSNTNILNEKLNATQKNYFASFQIQNNSNNDNNIIKFDNNNYNNNFSMFQDESPTNKKLNIDKNIYYHIKLGYQRNMKSNQNEDKENNLSNFGSFFSNNDMQKFNSFNEIDKRHIRSSSVGSFSVKLQNNNGSMSGRALNNKISINKNASFSSSPKCEKIHLKLKGDLNSSLLTPKNKKRNFIQLKQVKHSLLPFCFQNINKPNLSPFNIYDFKKKAKLDLSQLKFKLNKNNKQKIFLSPNGKNNIIKKNERTNSLILNDQNQKFFSTGKNNFIQKNNENNLGNIINNKKFDFKSYNRKQIRSGNSQRNHFNKKLLKNSSGLF